MHADLLQTFTDAVRLTEVDPPGATARLVTLCRNHADQVCTPSAVALTALDDDASRSRVHALVSGLRDELGLPVLESTDLQEAAVAAMCRRHLAGEVTSRELTYWVWRIVGLRGSEHTRTFMSFEDEYMRYAAYDCSAIDADVTVAARTFLEPPAPARRRSLFGRR